MYILKEEGYERLLFQYGEKAAKTPYAQAVRNGISPFYVIYENDFRIGNFVVYQDNENWLAFDRKTLEKKELMNFILEKLKPKYEYLSIYIHQNDKNLIDAANTYGFKKTEKFLEEHILMKKTF